jgi:class 3 adenylate cyclase
LALLAHDPCRHVPDPGVGRTRCQTFPPSDLDGARSRAGQPVWPSIDPSAAIWVGRPSTARPGSAECSAVAEVPETHFAETSGGYIAYQVVGDGPVDVLVAHTAAFPIDLMWDEPSLVRFLDRLSSFSRHVWFDPRGRGASDPAPHVEDRLAETIADDMLALVDHLGWAQVAVVGDIPLPILFAASHPERTKALVLLNTGSRLETRDGFPQGGANELTEQGLRDWGTGGVWERANPSVAGDAKLRRWLGRSQRLSNSRAEAAWRLPASLAIDLRPALPSVQAPTLFVCRQGLGRVLELARDDAQHISGAKVVEVPGDDRLFFVGDTTPMLDAIEEFLTGHLPAHRSDRVLATVLFTDIVGSTEHAAQMGDRRWKEVLAAHDVLLGAEVERFRGRMVKSTGDGVLATFDGPGRAIRCACAVRGSVRSLGIEVRAGLHSGEVELRGHDVGGIAVHIAARVAAAAGAGEVLVSRTVSDLVAGSGIEFEDRGEHDLKGVPGAWQLFSVVA